METATALLLDFQMSCEHAYGVCHDLGFGHSSLNECFPGQRSDAHAYEPGFDIAGVDLHEFHAVGTYVEADEVFDFENKESISNNFPGYFHYVSARTIPSLTSLLENTQESI